MCCGSRPVTSPTSVGPNRLLRDGAARFSSWTTSSPVSGSEGRTAAADPDPSTPSGSVIALLRGGPRQADELAATLRLPTGQILALLGIMEIQGLVLQRPGLTPHCHARGSPRVNNDCYSERSRNFRRVFVLADPHSELELRARFLAGLE
jgi:hypothetical protein